MMKSKRIFSCLLVVMLVLGITPLTAFAYADDDAAADPTVEASANEADTGEEATSDSTEESDEEVPYTYTISEDGSITITINGQEWELDAEDTEESTTTGKVVTQGSRLNLRTGAGMNYEIIDQLRPGEEVTVIGTEGDWYKVIVPEKTGYVHSDYLELLETAKENSEIDSAMLMLLLNVMFQNMNTVTTTPEQQATFTPDGNLSLIDDILQTEVYATEDTELKEKQFITLQSKSGNYFYLVIDRTGDTENVYFMQRPDATLVAGYNKWRDQFERHVKRGEHGITIIAPTPYRKKVEEQKLDPDTKAPMLDADGKVIQTGDNSFGYIATWSQGKELKELRDSLETINKTANQLITSIDRHFKEICKERGIDLAAAAEPEKDAVGALAKDIEAFMLDVDTFAYLADIGDDREKSLREITESLASGDVQGIRDWLREVVAYEDENTAPAQALLDRVDAMYPPAPQSEIPETAAPEQVDYRLVSNFRRASPDDTTYIQAYTYVGSEAPVPGEVLYVGTYDKCLELQEALKVGSITPEAVKAMNEGEKLYLVSDFRYLHIQRTDSGFDYTIYDKDTLALLDGGQLDNPDMHISTVCIEICEAFGLDSYAVTYAPLEMVETLQTAQHKPTQRDLLDKLADHFSQEDAAAWDGALELALDQYPMPDPQLTVADLEAHSYLDGDMLPLSRERAMELHEKDFTVYAISETGDAEMIFDAEDFTTHADSVIFAIERDEWERSPDFHQQIVDRLEHQEQREQAFLQHSADCFAIYQQKDDSPGRFRPFDEQKGSVQRSGYDLVYTGELFGDVTINAHLGSLWYKFNQEHPVDYHRPSLSVSDIVALKVGGVVSCHYVDSIGYKEVPDFIQPENYLRNAEMTIEDDYNMIDGIINNGTRQTEPAPEQKKKSVMEQLREKPKQPRKKTAQKRSAEQEL